MDNYYLKTVCIALIIVLLSASSILYADEHSPVSNTIVGTTKEYLSDPARTGSLVGSIIAGSAVANPLAPVLGSVVGFVIGKSSAFSKKSDNSASQNAYNNRSLIPAEGTEVTGLTGLSDTSPLTTASDQSVTTLADESAGTPTMSLGLDENSDAGNEATNEDTSAPALAAAQPTLTSDQTSGIVIVEEINHSHVATPLDTIVPTDLVRETQMGIHSIQPTTNGLRVESAGGADLQKQLADACSNYKAVKTASLNCYYYAQ